MQTMKNMKKKIIDFSITVILSWLTLSILINQTAYAEEGPVKITIFVNSEPNLITFSDFTSTLEVPPNPKKIVSISLPAGDTHDIMTSCNNNEHITANHPVNCPASDLHSTQMTLTLPKEETENTNYGSVGLQTVGMFIVIILLIIGCAS